MLVFLTKLCEDAIKLDTTIFIKRILLKYSSTQPCFKNLKTLKKTASLPAIMLSGKSKLVIPYKKARDFNVFFCSVSTECNQVFKDYSDRAHKSNKFDIYDTKDVFSRVRPDFGVVNVSKRILSIVSM